MMSNMQSHSIASRALLAIAAATVFAGVSSVNASQPDLKVLAFTPPDKINWTGNDANKQAILAGDPSKPGLYVVLTKWLPHHMSHPHFHPNDRYIYVISGTWWVGTGSKYDPDSTTPMPAGSFVTHYGKQIHYDGAKDEEVTLEIVGMGPATSTPAEVK
jgi:quercetin dioxygenase-like cupin family protein